MKATQFLFPFIVSLFVVGLGLNSSANADLKNQVQDTTSLVYWKDRAIKFEALARATEMRAQQAQMYAREESIRSKKINDESQAKIKELTAQLEECKKRKP